MCRAEGGKIDKIDAYCRWGMPILTIFITKIHDLGGSRGAFNLRILLYYSAFVLINGRK